MKKLLLGLLLLSSSVIAVEEKKETDKELCENLSKLAKEVMISRQAGVPMSKLIDIVDKDFAFIIVRAYEQPKFSLQDYKDNAANEYADEVYLLCYKARMQK